MQIGVDIRSVMAESLTGVGWYTLNLLKAVLDLDSKNSYKIFYNSSKPVNPAIRQLAGYNNVKLYGFNRPNKLFNASLFFLGRPKIDKMIGGCDLFWFPNFNFWSLSADCPSVVTVHDLSFEKIPWAYSFKMKQWHKLIVPRAKLSRTKKVIAVSQNTKRDLEEVYQVNPDKVEVVYSGINQPTDIDLSAVKSKYDLPEKFIFYLGTLEPRKNIEGLIEAFSKVTDPDCRLIIGGGEGWLYDRIYRAAKASPKADKIRFIGYISPEESRSIYQLASVFVWPSFYEGFGFPPLEAMAAGCPVITSANSSLPEIVGDAALLIDPYNINSISQTINQILGDNELRQQLINKGYIQAKKFNWRFSAEKMLKIFQSVNN